MEHDGLVRKAIFDPSFSGYTTASGIFIGSNESASRLEEIGPDVLPSIENVLVNSRIDIEQYYDRISSVLVSYFTIAHSNNSERAGAFLTTLQPPLLDLALAEVRFLWGPACGINRLRPIPQWLSASLTSLVNARASKSILETIECIGQQ